MAAPRRSMGPSKASCRSVQRPQHARARLHQRVQDVLRRGGVTGILSDISAPARGDDRGLAASGSAAEFSSQVAAAWPGSSVRRRRIRGNSPLRCLCRRRGELHRGALVHLLVPETGPDRQSHKADENAHDIQGLRRGTGRIVRGVSPRVVLMGIVIRCTLAVRCLPAARHIAAIRLSADHGAITVICSVLADAPAQRAGAVLMMAWGTFYMVGFDVRRCLVCWLFARRCRHHRKGEMIIVPTSQALAAHFARSTCRPLHGGVRRRGNCGDDWPDRRRLILDNTIRICCGIGGLLYCRVRLGVRSSCAPWLAAEICRGASGQARSAIAAGLAAASNE